MKEEHSPHNETVDVVVPVHVSKLEVSVRQKKNTHTHTQRVKTNFFFPSPPLLDKYVSIQMETRVEVWHYFIQRNMKYGHGLHPSLLSSPSRGRDLFKQ